VWRAVLRGLPHTCLALGLECDADVLPSPPTFLPQIRYLELKAAEKEHGPRPSKLKATVCADLLMKLCTSTGRYAKVQLV
jgi:hypothetical protein